RALPARLSGSVVHENRLDRLAEQARDLERQRQAGVVLAGLDGVDALARDVEPGREVRLAPVALGAQHFQAVLHRPRPYRLAHHHPAQATRKPIPWVSHSIAQPSANATPGVASCGSGSAPSRMKSI